MPLRPPPSSFVRAKDNSRALKERERKKEREREREREGGVPLIRFSLRCGECQIGRDIRALFRAVRDASHVHVARRKELGADVARVYFKQALGDTIRLATIATDR